MESDKNKKCFWPWSHDYSSWVDISVNYSYPETGLKLHKEGQQRNCSICNKKQVRIVNP